MAARQKPIYSNEMKHKICQKISEGKDAHTIADELGLEYNHDTFSSFISKVKNSTEAANAIGVEKTPAFYTLFSTID